MKAIVGNKLYDTEKATAIYPYKRHFQIGEIWGMAYYGYHEMMLYKTENGAYFEHDTEEETIKVISENEAMEIVRGLNPDAYMEIFNVEVEEG